MMDKLVLKWGSSGITSYVRVGILLTCGKHIHDRIITLRWRVLAMFNPATIYLGACTIPGK